MTEGRDGLAAARSVEQIAGVKTQVWRAGEGPPLLYLHPGDGFRPFPTLEHLARDHCVIAPSHPGFDGTDLPGEFRTVDDLAYWYLDLLDQLELRDAVLMGVSFGAWIAAEIAIKSTARLRALVLADAVGARFSTDPRVRDITDLFGVPQWEQSLVLHHDPLLQRRGFADVPQERLLELARNHDSFCLYGWSPTLHDPKLARRLHRIDVPTAVVWGEEDRVVNVDYGRSWARAMPDARFTAIAGAGHYAHLDQPGRFTQVVDAFVRQLPARDRAA